MNFCLGNIATLGEMSVQASVCASLMDVTQSVSHMGKNRQSCWSMLLHATNSQSLEEMSLHCAQKVLVTGLGELGYMFLREVKENSTFFLTDSFLFCQKSSTNTLMSY